MEEFGTRRDLLSDDELRTLLSRSDTPGLIHLAGHLGALVVGCWMISLALGTWWIIPAWVAHGVVLIFLFTTLHECIHSTAFRSRRLNNVVALVAGFAIALPPNYFRYFHFAHHRHTQDPQKDPEIAGAGNTNTPGQFLWNRLGITSYWFAELRNRLRHAKGQVSEPFIPASGRKVVVREARLFLLGYAVIAFAALLMQRPEPLLYWLIPALLGRPVLRLYLDAEHTGCSHERDMLTNTRTILTNGLVKALAWNMPYHVEHHLYPGVPFHALPRLYEHLKPKHVFLSSGYVAFHREFAKQRRSATTTAA